MSVDTILAKEASARSRAKLREAAKKNLKGEVAAKVE